MSEKHQKYIIGTMIGTFFLVSILGIYCLPTIFCKFICWLSGCEETGKSAKINISCCQDLYHFVE